MRSMDSGKKLCCPAAVHRWFADGEGWTYHPDVSIPALTEELKAILHQRPSAQKPICGERANEKNRYFYVCELDTQPMDPKAKHRSPSVFRVVQLPGPLRAECRGKLLEALQQRPLPTSPGRDAGLVLELPEEWFLDTTAPPEPSLAKAKKPIRWFLSTGATLMLAGLIVGFAITSCPQISPIDAHQRLLVPLGQQVPNPSDGQAVAEKIRQIYCQEGMWNLFFPDGPRITEFQQIWERPRKALPSQPDGQHPDLQFVWFLEKDRQFSKFFEAIQCLPKQPVKVCPFKEPVSQVVNAIAQDIPEEKRKQAAQEQGLRGTGGAKVAGTKGLTFIEKIVTERVVSFRSAEIEYEMWFYRNWRWEEGGRFPWEVSGAQKQHRPQEQHKGVMDAGRIARAFCRGQSLPSQQEAAQKMLQSLHRWGVKGLEEEDAKVRPWWVGRCFVEFLSLKHFALEKRQNLQKDPSLAARQLQKLLQPEKISPLAKGRPEDPAEKLWKSVVTDLSCLARKLGRSAGSDNPSALVEHISASISEWGEEIRTEFQREEKKRCSLDAEIVRLEKDIKEKEQELRSEKERLKEVQNLLEELDKANKGMPVNLPALEAQYQKLHGTGYPGLGKAIQATKELEEGVNKKIKEIENSQKELEQDKKNREDQRKENLRNIQSNTPEFNSFWERLTGKKLEDLVKELQKEPHSPGGQNQKSLERPPTPSLPPGPEGQHPLEEHMPSERQKTTPPNNEGG